MSTYTSLGVLAYSFPAVWWFDAACKARKAVSTTVWLCYLWLGGWCAVQVVQLPLRIMIAWRLPTGVNRVPREQIVDTCMRVFASLEWRMHSMTSNVAQGFLLIGSVLTSYAQSLTAQDTSTGSDSQLIHTVTVACVASAARMAFSFFWFFYNFSMQPPSTQPDGASRPCLAASLKPFTWKAPLVAPAVAGAGAAAVRDACALACGQSETCDCRMSSSPHCALLTKPTSTSRSTSPRCSTPVSTGARVGVSESSPQKVGDDADTDPDADYAWLHRTASVDEHPSLLPPATTPAHDTPTASLDARMDAGAGALSDNSLVRPPPVCTKQGGACSNHSHAGEDATITMHRTDCAVCLVDFAVGDKVASLPCSRLHVFHTACIVPWLSMHARCPLCAKPLPGSDAEASTPFVAR